MACRSRVLLPEKEVITPALCRIENADVLTICSSMSSNSHDVLLSFVVFVQAARLLTLGAGAAYEQRATPPLPLWSLACSETS